MSYDSKHSGAVAEQMLYDYVGGKLGGGGSAKVYNFDFKAAAVAGAVTQDVYDAIIAADVVKIDGILLDKVVDDGIIQLSSIVGILRREADATQLTSEVVECTIGTDLSFTVKMGSATIPTKTSQLTNDSGFITAADLPPSGGLPTEKIELSSEITLEEGKMLEIDSQTVVEGALTIIRPATVNGSQGLLWGIRFFCGQTVPQLTFRLGFLTQWMNGELPQLEPNVLVEIIGTVSFDGFAIMSWAKYK
jgi:hypothetical protein